MNKVEPKLTLVCLSPSCKRLVLYFDNTVNNSLILDHDTSEIALNVLANLKALHDRFTIRDVATGYEWSSTKGVKQ